MQVLESEKQARSVAMALNATAFGRRFRAMKHRLLFFCFFIAVVIMVLTGFYAVKANQNLLSIFEARGKTFKDAATAAAELSSYAKRAEGHLMLYLTLHRQEDKDKYPQRVKSVFEKISILDQNLAIAEISHELEKIKANSRHILAMGNALIRHHDTDLKQTGEFSMVPHRETVFSLHEKFSSIRRLGVELAAHLIQLEDDLKKDIFKKAMRLKLFLVLFSAVAAGFAAITGWALVRMITRLKEEIAARIESENRMHQERDKLKDAMIEVKLLSGMLPICSICKNIRDDKGYWNRIEKYISTRSEAEFSHSLCPDCAKKYYPDYFIEED